VHLQQRRLVIGRVGVHRADDAALVDHLLEVRERFGDLDARPAALLELQRRRKEAGAPGRLLVALGVGLLAGIFRQRRLGIEGVEVARAAVHEQEDGTLGFGSEVRDGQIGGWRDGGRGEGGLPEHARQRRHAEARAGALEDVSP
jgi:hypothetical protein